MTYPVLLSVVMSVYNSEDFLKSSIESILNQNFKDFEFIIIDDRSIDGSYNIMKKYEEKDKRIRLYKNKVNLGLTKSLNLAISYSKGKYIARQDADDISLPNRLKIQINFLETYQNYAFCGTNGYWKQYNKELIDLFEFNDIKKNLLVENCFLHSSIMLQKDIFNKFGNYDENFLYSQDYELWSRFIYKYGVKAKNFKEKLVIIDKPLNRFLKRNKRKFMIQKLNCIKIKLRYLNFNECRFKVFFSIFVNCCEIITVCSLIHFFTKFLKKM